MSLHSAPQMSLNGIENNSKDMNFLPDHSPVIIFALMMLSHNSIVINLIPLFLSIQCFEYDIDFQTAAILSSKIFSLLEKMLHVTYYA